MIAEFSAKGTIIYKSDSKICLTTCHRVATPQNPENYSLVTVAQYDVLAFEGSSRQLLCHRRRLELECIRQIVPFKHNLGTGEI